MKPVKKLMFAGHLATQFCDGTIIWAGFVFEQGRGASSTLLAAMGA